jgi:membrane-bound inhibitor of C-type lysozyme
MTDGQIQTLTYKIENNQINIQVMTDGQIQTLTYKIENNQINIKVIGVDFIKLFE